MKCPQYRDYTRMTELNILDEPLSDYSNVRACLRACVRACVHLDR